MKNTLKIGGTSMQTKMMPKPEWLRKKIRLSDHTDMNRLLDSASLSTVCQEAMCPNISECFRHKQATFLILGTICTRMCSFCAVNKGIPMDVDVDEPKNIAQTVKEIGLKHVVITSPTRDDLRDGGAKQFCDTVEVIKAMDNTITVELLVPDMQENHSALKMVANSGAEIIGHNLETVPRLYAVRSGAKYERSLEVLRVLHNSNTSIATKSGIMLGFGESDEEVKYLMQDLLDVGCKFLSIGQYLCPSTNHAKVVEYVKPERFERLRIMGMEMGFDYIKSSQYTRSSYMAHEYLNKEV